MARYISPHSTTLYQDEGEVGYRTASQFAKQKNSKMTQHAIF